MERFGQTDTDPGNRAADEGLSRPDNLIGKVIADKYEILSFIGQGGMSKVYLAMHKAMGKKVAVKILPNHLATQTQSLLRFKNEAQVASSLAHQGIVSVHDYGVTHDGTPYIVMDYIEGISLADLIERGKPIAHDRALDIFSQACTALVHAHRKGVVHRDLKPSNIMLEDNDHGDDAVKIVDLGIAKILTDTAEAPKLTQTGESIGSPLYMSPEQCLNYPLDTRSDIYSLGCVMYEVLTGKPPLSGDSVFSTMTKQINEMPAGFKQAKPEWNHDSKLERIVFKALAKDPNKRYQSMEELHTALAACQSGAKSSWSKQLADHLEFWRVKQGTQKNMMVTIVKASAALALLAVIVYTGTLIPSLSRLPSKEELKSEPQPWTIYPDEQQAPDEGEKAHSVAFRVADVFNEYQESTHFGSEEQLSQATTLGDNLRYRHHYFEACEQFMKVVQIREKQINHRTLLLNQNDKIRQYLHALFTAGLCQYYTSNFKQAGKLFTIFDNECEYLKHVAGFFPINDSEHMEADLKWADCAYFQGDFQTSHMLNDRWKKHVMTQHEKVRSRERVYALYFSKFAESELRTERFREAIPLYELAADEWSELSNDQAGKINQLLARAKLGECLELDGHSLRAAPVLRTASQQLDSDSFTLEGKQAAQFANAMQCYAHNLWNKGHYLEAFEVHKRAERLRAPHH